MNVDCIAAIASICWSARKVLLSSMNESYLLPVLILIPTITIPMVLIIPNTYETLIKKIGLSSTLFTFIISLLLWVLFDNSTSRFQFTYDSKVAIGILPSFSISLGVDGISLFFIILSTFLIPICLLASWDSIKEKVKDYILYFLILDLLLILVFSVLDILAFYIFFEAILIPMFLIIGIWGSRTRKIRAAYQFFLYTLLGSLFLLLGILVIYYDTGTTNFQVLQVLRISEERQILLWLAFFASFAVKVPMVPFHIWLPEAHVEAPTAGSVLLAGILLKLGTYGFLRYSISLFPKGSIYFTPFIYTLSVLAVIYTSLTTLRQIDLKKIIAYSSVAHMGLVTLGLFTANIQGIEGSILIMISHGFVSSALFLCVGVLYDRFHTRIIKYYNGLAEGMPLFAILFVFFTLANIAFPGTSSFSGEILTLFGAFKSNITCTVLASTGMVLGAAYSIWLCNRILFGPMPEHNPSKIHSSASYLTHFTDITRREFFVFLPLVLLTLWMGIYPDPFLEPMHVSVSNIVYNLKSISF